MCSCNVQLFLQFLIMLVTVDLVFLYSIQAVLIMICILCTNVPVCEVMKPWLTWLSYYHSRFNLKLNWTSDKWVVEFLSSLCFGKSNYLGVCWYLYFSAEFNVTCIDIFVVTELFHYNCFMFSDELWQNYRNMGSYFLKEYKWLQTTAR